MEYIVYILYSSSKDQYYVGQTNNIERRIKDHNTGYSKYTSSGIPWEVKYTKKFQSRSDAMKYEKEIKSKKSRDFINKIINMKEGETQSG